MVKTSFVFLIIALIAQKSLQVVDGDSQVDLKGSIHGSRSKNSLLNSSEKQSESPNSTKRKSVLDKISFFEQKVAEQKTPPHPKSPEKKNEKSLISTFSTKFNNFRNRFSSNTVDEALPTEKKNDFVDYNVLVFTWNVAGLYPTIKDSLGLDIFFSEKLNDKIQFVAINFQELIEFKTNTETVIELSKYISYKLKDGTYKETASVLFYHNFVV